MGLGPLTIPLWRARPPDDVTRTHLVRYGVYGYDMSIATSGAASRADDEHFAAMLDGARRGSGSALRHLYDSLSGEVTGYVRIRGATDVGAVTNEVFHRAFSRLDRFKGNESGFRSWVFKIAHNLLIDEHRKRIRRPKTVATIDTARHDAVGGDVETEAMAGLERADVARLLDSLTEGQRDVMYLRLIGGLTLAETADVLGRPLGAVKSLQHRAVERLRTALADSAYPISPSARSQR